MNPRTARTIYSLSRGAPSTTWVLLQSVLRFQSKKITERVGFEPTAPCGVTGFQDQLLKPLGHLSISYMSFVSVFVFPHEQILLYTHTTTLSTLFSKKFYFFRTFQKNLEFITFITTKKYQILLTKIIFYKKNQKISR